MKGKEVKQAPKKESCNFMGNELSDTLGLFLCHFPFTQLYGLNLHIDKEMPALDWDLVQEGDSLVSYLSSNLTVCPQ